MIISATRCPLQEILPYRDLYLQAMNCQVRYNACHERGWTDSYRLHLDELVIGYGSIKGKDDLSERDCIFEFFLLPAYRRLALRAFKALIQSSGAVYIECQSNDPFLPPLFHEFAEETRSEVVLFNDTYLTELTCPGVQFREVLPTDEVFRHEFEPPGAYVLAQAGRVVATGGFLLHYNRPFADLYMEVVADQRCKGLGSYLIQELKKACYQSGRVPAARTSWPNKASKACLEKAGMGVCGVMLEGKIKAG